MVLTGGRGYGPAVSPVRRCSRTACAQPAVATLTYVYADSTAVVGPLATYAEPHCYDLCEAHAQRLTAPRGWEVVRHEEDPGLRVRSADDLTALADAVREAARPSHGPVGSRLPAGGRDAPGRSGRGGSDRPGSERDGTGRRGHLRAVPSPR